MRSIGITFATLAAALAVGVAAAAADTMHPELGAKLAGMGDHGIVNLQSHATTGKLCWTFDLSAKQLTGASIRDTHGMIVAKLGSTYSAKGCATVSKKALDLIESKPHLYDVWVDTKGHPGDLRGMLFAGMAHM
jgi:hypothetical protein